MTNFEKWGKQLIERILIAGGTLDCVIFRLRNINGVKCDRACEKCSNDSLAWLQQEYKAVIDWTKVPAGTLCLGSWDKKKWYLVMLDDVIHGVPRFATYAEKYDDGFVMTNVHAFDYYDLFEPDDVKTYERRIAL